METPAFDAGRFVRSTEFLIYRLCTIWKFDINIGWRCTASDASPERLVALSPLLWSGEGISNNPATAAIFTARSQAFA